MPPDVEPDRVDADQQRILHVGVREVPAQAGEVVARPLVDLPAEPRFVGGERVGAAQGLAVDDLMRRRTWAELADRSCRVANFLARGAGVAPGEHVAVLMGNRTEYIELLLGGILAGAWVTPINWHLAEE